MDELPTYTCAYCQNLCEHPSFYFLEYGRAFAACSPSHRHAIAVEEQRLMRALQRSRDFLSSSVIGLPEWLGTLHFFGFRCAYCGAPYTTPTLDHVIAISHGGKSQMGNCVPACLVCNQQRKCHLSG